MDKRKIKTQEAAINGLRTLMLEKDYEDISVGDILKASGVSRTAFYANFRDKDDLLRKACDSIFDHVFNPSKEAERLHDFSTIPLFNYEGIVEHLFCHFYEDRELLEKIFSGTASAVFIDKLNKRILPLMEAIVSSGIIAKEGVPPRLLSLQLSSGFAALVEHWIKGGCLFKPKEITQTFFKLYQ